MSTFSQLVDSVVAETGRRGFLSNAADYLNQTLMELHAHPQTQLPVFYMENLREDRLVATSDQGQKWDLPKPALFQDLKFVRYTSRYIGNRPVVPTYRVPGRGTNSEENYYYRSGSSYFFSGYGGIGGAIELAYFERTPSLKYKPAQDRLITLDEYGSIIYDPSLVTDEQKQSALGLETNWLLLRYPDFILEGVRAKLYKRLADNDRARLCYSLWSEYRGNLISAEPKY